MLCNYSRVSIVFGVNQLFLRGIHFKIIVVKLEEKMAKLLIISDDLGMSKLTYASVFKLGLVFIIMYNDTSVLLIILKLHWKCNELFIY